MTHVVICSSVDSDLVRSVAEAAGADEVFSQLSEDGYRRLAGGGLLARLRLRWVTYAWYGLGLLARVASTRRKTVWIVTTNPFFAPGLACCAAVIRGHRVIHHVFDLYPDAIEAARGHVGTGRGGWIGAWTRFTQRRCDAAVYLGEELKRHAEERHGRAPRSAVIPVAADERLFAPVWPPLLRPLRVHYGGQLGLMHDAASIREAVLTLGLERERGEMSFEFMAAGARVWELASLHNLAGVSFEAPVPATLWRRRVSTCHLGLVSLSPEGAKVCLPSKAHALMAAGVALVAICPRESDLGRLVAESGGGWVVDNSEGDVTATARDLSIILQELVKEPERVEQARRAARAWAETRCGHGEIKRQWSDLLQQLATNRDLELSVLNR